jgi:cysteinyl-tRNA synthetase
MSLDIVRRVMKNYFGYDVVYLMSISDIDYKVNLFLLEYKI